MASETSVQTFVHQLEEGKWAKWIRLGALVSVMLGLASFFLFLEFRGLSDAHAMEQAQIAREIARGNGFSSKVIRPFTYHQFIASKGKFPDQRIPDVYHAPIPPLLLAGPLKAFEKHWPMQRNQIVYHMDRVIAGTYMIWFMAALGAIYLLLRRLFDAKLAAITVGLTMISMIYWDFCMAGLPLSLLLFLFTLTLYTLLRAVENLLLEQNPYLWLSATGVGFGLLAFTHAMTIWIFAGALLFVAIRFRPRMLAALGMLVIFLLIYTPWLYRNYAVYGNALGVSQYSVLSTIRGSENAIMRSIELSFLEVVPTFWKNKVIAQTIFQLGDLNKLFGHSIAALFFFVALLHPFKTPTVSAFRWALLPMWVAGGFGLAVFGFVGEEPRLNPNNLHPLFTPFFAAYGVAFILYLWNRLEIKIPLLRFGLISLIFLISGIPLVNAFFGDKGAKINWPPYLPPFIGILGEWTNEREIIMSDMPWAVAWYADRKSLWLTQTIKDFVEMNDYDHLGGAIVGLYLTPVTGNSRFVSGIMKGDYREWAPFITRNVTAKDFPLRAATGLPIDNECIFYADRDRWTERTD
jgi:hypothetical protein